LQKSLQRYDEFPSIGFLDSGRQGIKQGAFMVRGKRIGIAALTVSVLLAAGCNTATKPTKENFTLALNTYYSAHDECLFRHSLHFPYEVSTQNDANNERPGLEALAKAQMLSREEEKGIKAVRYTLTAAGSRASGRFCYGHRQVTTVDDFTPPAKASTGFVETLVSYHYVIKDAPVWAKDDDVKKAFPKMAADLGGQGQDKTTLAQTMAGWQVPE
jgi:hypothetical protein